jgi:hypothetical protein
MDFLKALAETNELPSPLSIAFAVATRQEQHARDLLLRRGRIGMVQGRGE